MTAKNTGKILDSHTSHFSLGYHPKTMSSTSSEFYKPCKYTPAVITKYDSALQLFTGKSYLKSEFQSSFTEKNFQKSSQKVRTGKKNFHSLTLGFENDSTHKENPVKKSAEVAEYVNLNDKTNVKLGTDHWEFETTATASFTPKQKKPTKEFLENKSNISKSSCYFGKSPVLYTTNSMDLKGIQVKKAGNLKVPDSKIFPKKNSDDFYATTQSTNFVRVCGNCTQNPTISNKFIYSQHFQMGNAENDLSKPKQEIPGITRDTISGWINREKVMGSEIELGMGANHYSTVYKKFFIKNTCKPELPIRNNKSSISLGMRKAGEKSEYDLEFYKKPYSKAEMPYPKNEIQNINVLKFN